MQKKNRNNKIVFIMVLFTILLSGCGKPDTTVYADPPPPATSADFPPHDIDISKYFTPVTREWNPEIKISQEIIDEIVGEEASNISPEGAYVQAYNMAQLGPLYRDVYNQWRFLTIHRDEFGKWRLRNKEIPFEEEFDACIRQAELDSTALFNKICRGEKVVDQDNIESFSQLEQQEKDGTITEGGKKNLEEYRTDPGRIHDNCSLPAEVRHHIYMKQYVEWDQCEATFRQQLKDAGYL